MTGAGRFLALPLLLVTLSAQAADDARPPLYFQDPSGAPFYAAGPKKTPDGRAYVPVFEDAPAGNVTSKPTSDAHRILYYRNPMGLPDTSPVPKKDAMGMDYIPVYADEGGDARGIVRISPARMQMLGVRTEEVAMRPALTRTIRATGALQFNERRLATVTTKAAGWIERLTVAATGDPVRQGEVLAELYAPDLVAAEQEYLVAARMAGPGMAHGDSGVLTAASLQRLRALDVPDDEIARLRKTGKVSRRIAVEAPADGVVIEKLVQEGMRIEPGQALYKTADLRDVWLIADNNVASLLAFRDHPHRRATDGVHGQGKRKHGRNGDWDHRRELVLRQAAVPPESLHPFSTRGFPLRDVARIPVRLQRY